MKKSFLRASFLHGAKLRLVLLFGAKLFFRATRENLGNNKTFYFLLRRWFDCMTLIAPAKTQRGVKAKRDFVFFIVNEDE